MLDFLWQVCLRSVLLSALVVSANKGVDILVRELDDQFRVLAEKKATQGKKIHLIDMFSSDGLTSVSRGWYTT
jgi:hypothetical protein